MRSLYRDYPVGGLLTLETQADGSLVRGDPGSPRADLPSTSASSSTWRRVARGNLTPGLPQNGA
jgi:hypothetical protein